MSSAVDSRPTLDEKASYGDDKPELEKTVAADVYAVDSDDDEGTCIRWRPRRQLLTLRPVVIDSEYTKEQYGKLKRKIGTSTSLLSCYSVLHRARLVPAPVDVALL